MKEKMKGEVRWFNEAKGYGFIVGSDNRDYFLHFSNIVMKGHKTLFQEDMVEFTPDTNEKGFIAKDVIRLKDKL